MPTFASFAGIRYQTKDLSAVIAPPYDVISDEERVMLEAADPFNAVRLELPQPDGESDRYQAAARRLDAWLGEGGPLQADPDPAFYVYRMSFTDDQGVARSTTGVIGALTLEEPGGGILPHERTTPKAKSDRLDLIRATRTNLSPVWGLSLATGLSELIAPHASPDYSAVDAKGIRHDVWLVRDPGALASIATAIGSAPVVIADGHHRYEVALAYQAESRGAGPWDAVMAYVVHLSEHELSVGATHRLITGLPDNFDLGEGLQEWFEPVGSAILDPALGALMASSGALGLVTAAGASAGEAVLLRPRAGTVNAASHDLDSSRLDVALAGLPGGPGGHTVSYQHGVSNVVEAVRAGSAQAAILLRPATVAQIAAVARTGDRMPPKTTFFTPKPATGLVFRSVR